MEDPNTPRRDETGEQQSPGKKKEKGRYLMLGVSLGLCFGVAFGVIFDNIATGVGIGLCIGIALGSYMDKKHDDE